MYGTFLIQNGLKKEMFYHQCCLTLFGNMPFGKPKTTSSTCQLLVCAEGNLMGEGITAMKKKKAILLAGETRQGRELLCLRLLSIAKIAQC